MLKRHDNHILVALERRRPVWTRESFSDDDPDPTFGITYIPVLLPKNLRMKGREAHRVRVSISVEVYTKLEVEGHLAERNRTGTEFYRARSASHTMVMKYRRAHTNNMRPISSLPEDSATDRSQLSPRKLSRIEYSRNKSTIHIDASFKEQDILWLHVRLDRETRTWLLPAVH
jgi:hypothetical protein